jgi:hypothetical protein
MPRHRRQNRHQADVIRSISRITKWCYCLKLAPFNVRYQAQAEQTNRRDHSHTASQPLTDVGALQFWPRNSKTAAPVGRVSQPPQRQEGLATPELRRTLACSRKAQRRIFRFKSFLT